MRLCLGPGNICRALIVFALVAAPAPGSTGVPAWEQTFRQSLAGSGYQFPLAARELADGTRLVVVSDNGAFSAVRYDASGSVLGASSFYPAYTTRIDPLVFGGYPTSAAIAIDPFGGVFVGAISGLSSAPFYSRGDAWFMKYDGLTGRAAWSSAALWTAPSGLLAAPKALFVDGDGDLVASVIAKSNSNERDHVVLKFDGSTGTPVWGPAILPLVLTSAAALDGAGNVVVAAGTSNGSSTAISTVKYAGATGAPVWGPVVLDGDGYENVAAVAADTSGDVVVSAELGFGVEHAFETFKLDGQSGALKWGPSLWTAPGQTFGGRPTAMVISPSGDLFVSGYVQTSTEYYYATLGVSGANGSILWGPATQTVNQPLPLALAATGNGDVILSTYDSNYPDVQLVTTRYGGRDGATLWGPEVLDVAYITPPIGFVAASGNLFIAEGSIEGSDTNAFVLERAGSTGAVEWGPVAFAGAAAGLAHLHDLTVGPDGNVIVTGFIRNANGYLSWATLKYDAATGSTIWGPALFDTGSPGGLNPYQVVTDAAGNAIVVGYLETGNELRLAVVKYVAGNGAQLWASGIISDFIPYGVAVDGAGNAVVVGRVFNGADYDTALVKLSSATGQAIWGPVLYDIGPEEYIANVAVDAAGDLIVAGSAYDPFKGTQDWFTFKAGSATGALLWGPVLIPGVYQTPARAAVDPSGDVVVVGTSQDQMLTIKYSGASGAVLWGPVFYDSPAHYAGGLWLAIDASGDVFSEGISWSLENDVYNADYVTIKYRGSDGATLWGPVLFNGPDDGYDFPYAVELDAGGNPVVSGDTETTSDNYRIATLKYDGATGNVIWGPVLTWPSGDNDLNGLAVRGDRVFLGGVADRAYRTTVLTEALGIATAAEETPLTPCGGAVDVSLVAENGTPGYSWTIVSGALPAGVTLANDGTLSGSPSEEGAFPFRAQVQDSIGATAARDYTLLVGGGPFVPILASADTSCQVTLSLANVWAGYQWLPGGETTASIVVSPLETTTYGVILSDGSGCLQRGSITAPATALTDPACLAPSLDSVSPSSGPASGGTSITLTGARFQSGAEVRIGGATAAAVVVSGSTELTAQAPALSPGSVYGVVLENPDSTSAALARAWTTDFLDVPPSNPFYDEILAVLRAGISSGCGGGNYCPDNPVTRAQMAVFLLKAEHGSEYEPPACTGVYEDVQCPGAFAADWIEQLSLEGVTAGCGNGNYCPDDAVTRAQMAVFLLKTLLTSAYVPPVVAQIFDDVAPGAFAYDWINDLYGRGVTGGCSASPLLYCPDNPNTRAQMAVFLVRTFSL